MDWTYIIAIVMLIVSAIIAYRIVRNLANGGVFKMMLLLIFAGLMIFDIVKTVILFIFNLMCEIFPLL